MTPPHIKCPHCGSYDLEWISEDEVRCLDCGRITRNPPGLLHFPRRSEDLEDTEKPNGNGEKNSWDDIKKTLE